MVVIYMRAFLLTVLLLSVHGYRFVDMKLHTSNIFKKIATGAVGFGLATTLVAPANTNAMETSNTIPESMRYITERKVKPLPYYFGVGCFWHVQHEVSMNVPVLESMSKLYECIVCSMLIL